MVLHLLNILDNFAFAWLSGKTVEVELDSRFSTYYKVKIVLVHWERMVRTNDS